MLQGRESTKILDDESPANNRNTPTPYNPLSIPCSSRILTRAASIYPRRQHQQSYTQSPTPSSHPHPPLHPPALYTVLSEAEFLCNLKDASKKTSTSTYGRCPSHQCSRSDFTSAAETSLALHLSQALLLAMRHGIGLAVPRLLPRASSHLPAAQTAVPTRRDGHPSSPRHHRASRQAAMH